MDNHFLLPVKMIPENGFSDDDIQKRFEAFYGDRREFAEDQIPYWREKLSSISEIHTRNQGRLCQALQPASQPPGLFLGGPLQKHDRRQR
jgi:hypothetical protein